MSAPEGIRTPNLLIRSQMLYPLSYGRMLPRSTTATGATGTECIGLHMRLNPHKRLRIRGI
jgi:hypothetical protein